MQWSLYKVFLHDAQIIGKSRNDLLDVAQATIFSKEIHKVGSQDRDVIQAFCCWNILDAVAISQLAIGQRTFILNKVEKHENIPI